VDSCVAKSQPARLLSGGGDDDDDRFSLVLYRVYDTVSIGEINGVWRFGEDKCTKMWNSRNNPSLYAGTGLVCQGVRHLLQEHQESDFMHQGLRVL